MAEERVESLPDVPTLKEVGIDLSIGTWRGLAVPKETPKEVVAKLEESFGETAQSDEFKATLDTLGLGYRYEDAEGFSALMEEQDQLFGELIPSLNLN